MPILSRHNVNFGLDELRVALDAGWDALRGQPNQEHVGLFEAKMAEYHGVRFALATGSGRAALYLALQGLHLPPGSRVALPECCFYTLPRVVQAAGLEPVFLPCHPRTYTFDLARLEAAIPADTRALVVIHPFGQAAPLDALVDVCALKGMVLLEDPSQSIGTRYLGRPVGSFGRAAAVSLVSGKNMTAAGGGMLLTDDPLLAEEARGALGQAPEVAGAWGSVRETFAQRILTGRKGFAVGLYGAFRVLNEVDRSRLEALFEEEERPFEPSRGVTRLSPVQAGLGLVQLERLDRLNARRRSNGLLLLTSLAGCKGLELLEVDPQCEPTFNAFPVRVADALRFQRDLLRLGIDTRGDYMRWYGPEGARRQEVVYLPTHPELDEVDMVYVARGVRKVLEGAR